MNFQFESSNRVVPRDIRALVTCYNRWYLTDRLLAQLSNYKNSEINLHITVVDGGSTDGTPKNIRNSYPNVDLIQLEDSYWCESMHLGMKYLQSQTFDYIWWVNDDVSFTDPQLDMLIQRLCELDLNTILVGKLSEIDSSKMSYGGIVIRRRFGFFRFSLANSGQEECDSMNGNCVLIPREVVDRIGLISKAYRHSFGDIEYGIRAKSAGMRIIQTAFNVGTCSRNTSWHQELRSFTFRNWRTVLFHPKGLPISEWWEFSRNNLGPLGRIHFLLRILRMFVRGLQRK